MTLSGFMDSVMELVRFVGRLATVGLQLEGCHSLLLSFILDFYETVINPDYANTFHLVHKENTNTVHSCSDHKGKCLIFISS